MKALLFGAGGQDAHYLSEVCREHGLDPVAVSRSLGDVRADVGTFDDVEALVRDLRPSRVFHLAATSTTRHDAVLENHRTISTGAVNVLEAVRRHCPNARVFLTGSGLQFVNSGAPISEGDPFDPSSPYAVSRIHSVYTARYYRSLGLRAYVGYLFHHESPLRKPSHVSQLVAQAARRVAAGGGDLLELGDLDVEKEWTFAGDVARAVYALIDQDEVFEAAIGSGRAHSIREWVECCFAHVGKDWREHVRVKPGFVPEYRRLVSNPATIRRIGWDPKVGLDELAVMMVGQG